MCLNRILTVGIIVEMFIFFIEFFGFSFTILINKILLYLILYIDYTCVYMTNVM